MSNQQKKDHKKSPFLVYILSFIVSLLLTVPFWFFREETFAIVLESIGCSGIAASIIAIFLYLFEERNEKKRVETLRKHFLEPIHEEIVSLIQKTMWVDENIARQDIQWNLDMEKYLKLAFYVITSKIKSTNVYSKEEGKKKMVELSKKYNSNSGREYDFRTRKAFQIIYAHCIFLSGFIKNINDNKVILDQIGVIHIGSIEQLSRYLELLRLTFGLDGGNIGSGIMFLRSMFEIIDSIYTKDIQFVPSFTGRFRD